MRMSPKPDVGCSKRARTIVWMCGIDVSSTRKGHVQPALIQIQRYSSHAPMRTARTATVVPTLIAMRRTANTA